MLGQRLHEARATIEGLLERRRTEIGFDELAREMAENRIDLSEFVAGSIPAPPLRGHLHLVSLTRDALEDVFVGWASKWPKDPEIETDWFNFGALNIPPAHPARGMWDTFYLDLGEPETTLLRTHTSPVQIHLDGGCRGHGGLPIHAVMPGRCYRRDTPDARHLAGVPSGRGSGGGQGDHLRRPGRHHRGVHHRILRARHPRAARPAYFPFTEPSAEFEVTCTICHGDGCRTCSQTGWIELGGCGMVDPAVFAAVGIDPEEWTGFAFGFGIDRCAQMRHQIVDMRALTENDIRFLHPF